jgi:GT2 family glycosyltransferase
MPALAALYWHLTRRRLRARNRLRTASLDLPFAYAAWITRRERNGELLRDAATEMENWESPPRFSILLHGEQDIEEQLKRSIVSVERQIYPNWTFVDGPMDELETRIAKASGDYLVPLRIGDRLSEASLYRIAEALQKDPDAAILYGDEDELGDEGQRCRPWFKPRWNQEMFLAQDYLSSAAAIDMELARKSARNATNVGELMLSATLETGGTAIVHVPHILCHVARRSEDHDSRLATIARHLEPLGAICTPGPFGTVKVEWPLPSEAPLVSIIIPTKDKIELLRPCVETVLKRTSYASFELLIIDNASVEQRTADYLAEIETHPQVRVLSYPGPYNFSAINNFAAEHAHGSHLCLLNNDTEVIEGDWLTEMMRYAVRPEVGAVGAKLLYDDGSLQHAGVVIGIGDAAGHAHRFLPRGQPGYFRQPHITQFVSAVTAACLVIEKSKFLAVGGFDAAELAVAFNDVDFCLKLEAQGWRNVYVPHAVLLHHESKSRGNDTSPVNIDRYRRELGVLQARWGTKTYSDPLHNPNLDRYSETFVIDF